MERPQELDSTGSNSRATDSTNGNSSSSVNMNTIESQRFSRSSASNNGRTTEQPTDDQQPSCSTSGNAPQPQNRSASAALDTDDDETRDHGCIYGVSSAEMSAIRQAILNDIDEDEEDYSSDDSGIESCVDD